MAKGKKSVLLYCDLIHTIEKMNNETAGEFFKHYLRYINDLNPTTDNLLVDVTFESVKQNLKRDLKKWETRAERSRNNGKLGGRPKKDEPKKPSGLINNLDEPKKPDTDTVNVTVTVTDKDIKENKFNVFWDLYPKKVARSKCLDKWHKLKDNEIEKILSTIKDYVAYKPFKDYTHPNPMTYLNQERWNDEITINPPKKEKIAF